MYIAVAYLPPGGRIGEHPAATRQLFAVVVGEGWVSGSDGEQRVIGTGHAAFWETGERHAAGTDTGITSLIVEGDDLDPDQFMSQIEPIGADW